MTPAHVLSVLTSGQKDILVQIALSNWLAVFGRLLEMVALWMIYNCWTLLRKQCPAEI